MAHTESTPFAARAAYWPLWAALGLSALIIGLGILQSVPVEQFFKENQPVEDASVTIFLCGAVGFLVLRPDLALGRGWQVTVIMLLMAARELDFDKRFMDKGILQLRLYSGDYPLQQKIIGMFFVMLILFTLYRLVKTGWRPLMAGLREPALWSWAVIMAIIAVVIAKSLDGAGRKLAPFGIELSAETDFWVVIFEEVGELTFALLLVLAICNWVSRNPRSSG